MILKLNDKGNIELEMAQIIEEVVANTPDDELNNIIEMFAWQKRIRNMISVELAEEFSRENYNTNIHEARDLFLKHIKQEEIKYYASVISNQIGNEKMYNEKYFKLYHWCRDKGIFQEYGYPEFELNSREDIPVIIDWEHKLAEKITKVFNEKFIKEVD